jgi:hypothetical protein
VPARFTRHAHALSYDGNENDNHADERQRRCFGELEDSVERAFSTRAEGSVGELENRERVKGEKGVKKRQRKGVGEGRQNTRQTEEGPGHRGRQGRRSRGNAKIPSVLSQCRGTATAGTTPRV